MQGMTGTKSEWHTDRVTVETEKGKPGGDVMKRWVRQDRGGRVDSTEKKEEEKGRHGTKWRRIFRAALGIVRRGSILNNTVKVSSASSENVSSFNMVQHTRAIHSSSPPNYSITSSLSVFCINDSLLVCS